MGLTCFTVVWYQAHNILEVGLYHITADRQFTWLMFTEIFLILMNICLKHLRHFHCYACLLILYVNYPIMKFVPPTHPYTHAHTHTHTHAQAHTHTHKPTHT